MLAYNPLPGNDLLQANVNTKRWMPMTTISETDAADKPLQVRVAADEPLQVRVASATEGRSTIVEAHAFERKS